MCNCTTFFPRSMHLVEYIDIVKRRINRSVRSAMRVVGNIELEEETLVYWVDEVVRTFKTRQFHSSADGRYRPSDRPGIIGVNSICPTTQRCVSRG